jgi:BlaI family penicillinase repressor
MKIKIPDAELDIMRILWREGRPLKISEFLPELEELRGWAKSTTATITARMRDKGLIAPDKPTGVARYVPCVTEEEYLLSEERAVLEKFGSGKRLAMAMVRSGHLTDEDIAELRDFFNKEG